MSMYIGVRSHAFRFFAVILAVFLTVGFAGAAAQADDHESITICHANEGRPGYVLETIALPALPTHETHQDREDIIPAPAEGCPGATDSDEETGNNGNGNGNGNGDGDSDEEGDDDSDEEGDDADDDSDEEGDDADDDSDEEGDEGETPVKLQVCHVNRKGEAVLKEFRQKAYDRHLAHGDKAPINGACAITSAPTDPVDPNEPSNPTDPEDPEIKDPVIPTNPVPPATPGNPNGPKDPEDPKGEDGKGENPGAGSGGGSTEGPGEPGRGKPNKPGKPGSNGPIVDGVEGDRPGKGSKGERPGNGPEPVKVSELVVVPATETTSRVNRPGARVNRPAAKILPATGAGDNLGLLGATGLGMVLFGGLLLTGQRRLVRVRR